MIIKHFRITVGLLALGAIASLPIAAGQDVRKVNPKPSKMQLPPVNLTATAQSFPTGGWAFLSCKAVITVRNNTAAVIPAGTTIYWSIKSGQSEKKGSFVLEEPLPSGGGTRGGTVPGTPCNNNPAFAVKSWYIPKAMPPVS
jgi:hypothetical protein